MLDSPSSAEQLIGNSNAVWGLPEPDFCPRLPAGQGLGCGDGAVWEPRDLSISDRGIGLPDRPPGSAPAALRPPPGRASGAGAAGAAGMERGWGWEQEGAAPGQGWISPHTGTGQAQRGCQQAGVLLGPDWSCWVLLGPGRCLAGSYSVLLGPAGSEWAKCPAGHRLFTFPVPVIPRLPSIKTTSILPIRKGKGQLSPAEWGGSSAHG